MSRLHPIWTLCVLLLGGVASPLLAQDGTSAMQEGRVALAEGEATPKYSLEYLSDLALKNHPVLRRDGARIESAQGGALQAGLYPNPRFDTNNPEVFAGKNSTFNAGFMQEIVVKGKLRLDRAAAVKGVQQAEFGFVQDKFQLLTAVRSQFYTVLAAQRRVDVLNRLLKITDASVKTSEQRIKAAQADKTELLLLTIDNERVQADLQNAERLLIGERGELSALVGFPGLVTSKVSGSLISKLPSYDEKILQQFVSSEHAAIQIAKLDIDKNKILLERAEVEPYPNVTVGPAYQFGFQQGAQQLWMTVTFPIPFSDRNQGNIRSARANVHDAKETLGAVQLELLRKLADTLARHRGAAQQAEKYKTKIIPDSLQAMRLAKSGFDQGIFDFPTYLQAQRTVVETNISYIGILETVWTSAAELAGLLQVEQFP